MAENISVHRPNIPSSIHTTELKIKYMLSVKALAIIAEKQKFTLSFVLITIRKNIASVNLNALLPYKSYINRDRITVESWLSITTSLMISHYIIHRYYDYTPNVKDRLHTNLWQYGKKD